MSKMDASDYLKATQERIADLVYRSGTSQKHTSQLLGLSTSYIGNITNKHSAPSLKELFAIMIHFNMDPAEFFSTMTDEESPYNKLFVRIKALDEKRLKLLEGFLDVLENPIIGQPPSESVTQKRRP